MHHLPCSIPIYADASSREHTTHCDRTLFRGIESPAEHPPTITRAHT